MECNSSKKLGSLMHVWNRKQQFKFPQVVYFIITTMNSRNHGNPKSVLGSIVKKVGLSKASISIAEDSIQWASKKDDIYDLP